MAFISEEQYVEAGSFGVAEVVECRRCDEDGLIWDRTKTGKNWLFSVKLANAAEKAEFSNNPKANAFYRMTKNYGLVIVDKRAAHMCSAATAPEGVEDDSITVKEAKEQELLTSGTIEDGRELRPKNNDGLSDLDENEADELIGLILTDET